MLEYTIQCFDEENQQVVFIPVQGYKLQNGLAAHKDTSTNKWVLDDLNSGGKIADGFSTFNNLKAMLSASDILQKVFNVRKSERYALMVRHNREKKPIKIEKKVQEHKEELWEI